MRRTSFIFTNIFAISDLFSLSLFLPGISFCLKDFNIFESAS